MIRFVRAALRCCSLALVLLGAVDTTCAADPTIRGAGATFPYPIYAAWASAYKRATGVEIAYEPVGSGAGVERIERRLVDFGATDVPLTPGELQRTGMLQFPAVIGGVVPVVNISGVRSTELKLTGQVLGDIYLGKIRKWNDPAITALNPGLELPSENITVVHRSDSSGTTHIWSDFLSRSNPEWKAKMGAAKVLHWPVGVGDVGNEGVASSVQRTRVSIGYVEYAYAKQHNLHVASVRNRDGVFVQPGMAAFEAAAMSAGWSSVADLDRLLIDQRGAASWPMVGATFILLPIGPQDASRTLEVMKFFDWAFRQGRQAAIELDYVPLPDSAVELIGKRWAEQVGWPAGRAPSPASTAPGQ